MTFILKNDVNVASKSNKQKILLKKNNNFLLSSWRSLTKIPGSRSGFGSESGSDSQRCESGSAPKCHGSPTWLFPLSRQLWWRPPTSPWMWATWRRWSSVWWSLSYLPRTGTYRISTVPVTHTITLSCCANQESTFWWFRRLNWRIFYFFYVLHWI
jgi:hypothetical protein